MVERLRAVPAHLAVAVGCGLAAVAAVAFAVVTGLDSHRIWGVLAALGYLTGAGTAWRTGRAGVGLRVAAVGAALVPATALVVAGIRQPEVDVVERSARVLLDTGSPYLAAPGGLADVNPYLPGMTVFGLPRLLFGDSALGDARLWFLAAFLVALGAALAVSRGRPVVWAVLACPLVALPVAVGGHDLPVVGLLCLGLALAARGRPEAAGAVLGMAAILKQSAWPGIVVAVALLAATAGAPAARRCALVSCAVLAAVLVPVLLGPTGAAALAQIAGFPLGTVGIASPATSPTPGVLLAGAGPVGQALGFALLAAAVGGLTTWLWRRPPSQLAGAAAFLALAETVAVLVLPTSRAGYLVYPVVLLLFAHSVRTPEPEPLLAGRA